ncbi:MAG: hypothetical protein K2X09_06395 [Rickettsiales bacterium]|nr:hypothetical protein [Rickettsiales bacterium]
MKTISILLLSVVLAATPALAKRYNPSKDETACVPSPNPDVPPCDLDPLPIMPSEVAQKAKEKEDAARNKIKNKKAKPLNKNGGW